MIKTVPTAWEAQTEFNQHMLFYRNNQIKLSFETYIYNEFGRFCESPVDVNSSNLVRHQLSLKELFAFYALFGYSDSFTEKMTKLNTITISRINEVLYNDSEMNLNYWMEYFITNGILLKPTFS